MTKQFKDYPEDLQRIVELTPDGWPTTRHCDISFLSVGIGFEEALFKPVFTGPSGGVEPFTRTEYEQCRAAYLHETAADIKAGEVDWRGLCDEFSDVLDGFYRNGRDDIDSITDDNIISLLDRVRAALDKSK